VVLLQNTPYLRENSINVFVSMSCNLTIIRASITLPIVIKMIEYNNLVVVE